MDYTAMLAFMPSPGSPRPRRPACLRPSVAVFYETEHKCETARLQKVTAIFTQVGAA